MIFAEIKKQLSAPVPTDLISVRNQGNRDIHYVNVTDYKDLLDQRAGIWEAIVMDFKQIGESLCCVVRLTIHADDGSFTQDGTGIEPLNTSSYGDPFSNAYAQAFRRACEGFGLSRELWRGDHEQPRIENRPSPVKDAMQPRQSEQRAFAPAAKPENPVAGDAATPAQLGAIRAIAEKHGLNAEAECMALYDVPLTDINKQAASFLIDTLKLM